MRTLDSYDVFSSLCKKLGEKEMKRLFNLYLLFEETNINITRQGC